MSWFYYPRRETVAERKSKAQKNLQRLRKKHPDIRPIIIEGKGLVKSWWGKAWNANLESYADYSNRIGRGRSYVKNGFVLDLKLTRGRVEAQVMGTSPRPYSVNIRIAGLTKQKWAAIKRQSRDKIDSLQELLDGSFPRGLEAIFTAKGAGLFPSPGEIKLSCSCPDWAVMCKHVAATLYGVGTRLDVDPGLFFTLRGVDVGDLVSTAINKRRKEVLDSAAGKKRSARVIEGDDARLASLFAIDIVRTDLPIGKLKATQTNTRNKLKKIAKKPAKKKAGKKKVKKHRERRRVDEIAGRAPETLGRSGLADHSANAHNRRK